MASRRVSVGMEEEKERKERKEKRKKRERRILVAAIDGGFGELCFLGLGEREVSVYGMGRKELAGKI